MTDFIVNIFSYSFIVKAVIVGSLVSLCSALLGVSLVLKRYSMIGDGLSHVGFGALTVALAFNLAPLQVAIPVVMISAYLLLRISQSSKINGDSAIALISSSALAVGIVVIALTNGLTTDIDSYMFGSILAMSDSDVILSIACSIVVIVLFALFYNKIFAVTFDENFSKATGIKTSLFNMLLAFLTAIVIVIGMRMMGTLLISSLIIFPALTSMRVCKSFKAVTICSVGISVCSFIIGIVCSFLLSTPAGATVVIVNLTAFIVFYIIGKLKRV